MHRKGAGHGTFASRLFDSKAVLCLGRILHRGVVYADLDVLTIISKGFAEDRKTADMFCIVLDSQTETDAAAVIEIQGIDRDI